MLTPAYKKILRLALPLALAAALGGVLFLRLRALAARDTAAGHTVILNEVCAKNLTGYTDAAGRTVPWIELRNVSGQDLDLGGYTLSNDPDWPDQFTFPYGMVMAGQGDVLLLLLADGAGYSDADGVLHLNFTPRYQNETLTLYAPDGSVADTLHYDELPYDMTYGRRLGDAVSTGYFAAATPGAHNPAEFWQADGQPADLGQVRFSAGSGFYEDDFSLTLTADDPDALILYTTDGSEPTLDSALYTRPIPVRSRSDDANVYSTRAAALHNDWLQNYAYRYGAAPTDKCLTVTARLYKNGQLGEQVTACSYWVGVAPHTLPVVSLSTAPDDLFGPGGIYVPGTAYFTMRKYGSVTGNGNLDAGRRVPASVSILDVNGTPLLQGAARVGVTGGVSLRVSQLKNLTVRLQGAACAGLLPQLPDGEALRSFVLRGGRAESDTSAYPGLYQDAFLSNYLNEHGLYTLPARPMALYLDGEYWGVCTLRESKNKDLFRRRFGLAPGNLYAPDIQTVSDWNHLWVLAESVDALDPATALSAAEELVDMEDFIRFIIAGIFTNNTDGLYNCSYNTVGFRSDTVDPSNPYADGRWRFILNDLDWTLAGVEQDPFAYLLDTDFSPAVNGGRTLYAAPNNLFQKLWQNAAFRQRFAAELRRELATTYAPENLLPAWDAWCAALRPELDRLLPRQSVEITAWAPLANELTGIMPQGQSLTAAEWEQNAAAVRDFLARRADIVLTWLDAYLAVP